MVCRGEGDASTTSVSELERSCFMPRVLLLDEPLSSLDPELRATLRDELARLRRTLCLTMVYVTHDMDDAAVLADRVIEMRAGRIVAITDGHNRGERT
jgi:ABC-type sulfate/molybdate transport systems ATPase subunit